MKSQVIRVAMQHKQWTLVTWLTDDRLSEQLLVSVRVNGGDLKKTKGSQELYQPPSLIDRNYY